MMKDFATARRGAARLASLVFSITVLATGCEQPADPGQAEKEDSMRERPTPFVPPAGTVAVDFRVDDRANRVYRAGDLVWKGSFLFDPPTRVLTLDPTWSGAVPGAAPLSGWPTLFDDGPWTRGGHEPEGSRARDHVWGVTAFVPVPAFDPAGFQYGLTDATYEAAHGNGWSWRKGPNGAFTVAPGQTGAIEAEGMAFRRFGRADLRLELDTGQLEQPWVGWNTASVGVKSSAWGWGVVPMAAEGGGRYAVELGQLLASGDFDHSGRLAPGDQPEFVFVLTGVDYTGWIPWEWTFRALTGGVTASFRCEEEGPFVTLPLEIDPAKANTQVTVPGCPCDRDER